MNSTDFIVYGVSATLMTLAAVEVAKEVGVPSRLAPVVAIVTGILLGMAGVHQAGGAHPDYIQGIFSGVAAALGAMGIYSGARALRSGSSATALPLAYGVVPAPAPTPAPAPVAAPVADPAPAPPPASQA